MSGIRERLHELTHAVPGVPAHVDHAPGHQGHRGRAPQLARRNHSPRPQGGQLATAERHAPRKPRVLVGWQERIAAFFGQELPRD